MNRRTFLSSLPLGAALARGFEAAPKGAPNVVMLIGDDQAWSDYSFMGHPHIRTPHLDRLAEGGITFRRGYVPSSLCRPSLATMITGLFPHQHKITSNDPPLPPGKRGAAAEQDPTFRRLRQEMIAYIDKSPTLPRLLSPRGYQSHQSGKWWEGNHCRCGFTAGMTHGDPSRGGRHGDEGLKIGRQGLKEVFDFIDQSVKQKTPFYAWYAPFMPHAPHNPPERFLARYRGKTPSLRVAKYWAMCEWFDETCGELVAHLDRKGIRDNTLVLYVCDNGWIQDPDSDGYAPRSKRSPYDGGLRTPILANWRGTLAPREAPELAHTIDLVPTILHACGLQPTRQMQGLNLTDREALRGRDTLYGEVFTHNAVDVHNPAANLQYRWVIQGDWKLILPAVQNVPDGKPELFHITYDPWEKQDLAAREPERVARLRAMLDRWWSASSP